MKKIIVCFMTLFTGILTVYGLSNNFLIDTSKLFNSNESKDKQLTSNFNDKYSINYSIKDDNEDNDKIIELTKKVTSLLLGNISDKEESSEEYYNRRKDYLSIRYSPNIPKTNDGNLDKKSQEYKDDVVSGFSIPGMFNKINNLNIKYSSFGDIRISRNSNVTTSMIIIPKVTMKEEDKNDPTLYDKVETNLIIYYSFKNLNGEYKLYYLMAEVSDDISKYTTNISDNEKSGVMQLAPDHSSDLRDIYDFSKVDSLSSDQINNIYNSNKDNIVILNSYYNNYSVSMANGFFINDGIIVTTWSFMQKSLMNAQYIVIRDVNDNVYEMDGIITANPDSDIVLIKLKNNVNHYVNIGDFKNLKLEDPVISISSKAGIGLTLQKGIVISNNNYIESSIPLTSSDEGSPVLNQDGYIVGMNTSKQVDSSISLSSNSDMLKEIQSKFNAIDFSDIEVISFDSLKEKMYYTSYNSNEVKNNIPADKWKEFSSVGNIESNIKLELVKANYNDGAVSLRYKNDLSNYISSMQLSSSFKNELINQGFTEKLESLNKSVYENNKYKIMITNEFNYLIIVMVIK